MPAVPARLDQLRDFFKSVDWERLRREIGDEARLRIAIVGPVNAGKSTLFNTLKGRTVSPVSPVAGTTTSLIREDVGPFTLIDTPGFGQADARGLMDIARMGIAEAGVVVLLLDAVAGLRQSDLELFLHLKATGKPLVVALNKIDAIGGRLNAVTDDLYLRLGVHVIPISALRQIHVADSFVPRLIEAQPEVAVAIGRELPAFRQAAANHLIRNATMLTAGVALEPIPYIDIPLLLANQMRLVLRIAAIYGEPMTASHAKELVTTLLAGLTLRYVAGETAKAIPLLGDVVASAMAAAATYAIGQVAVEYFESGKVLKPSQLRTMLRRLLKRTPPPTSPPMLPPPL